ncbi:ABC transporter substrate-binding protein [Paenibacillus thalictri]|uniref:Extracellular solute-binding protein n=1 Tax=Paenibacillus thalictri TaxID=2527873 RepID=A0A4V2J4Z5_9BACL|nr:extracellular solute-binding protein [Paenibacillus thalictri]TBL81812.1 extracellular solute-binding protein [Paenibacillus thalictri]
MKKRWVHGMALLAVSALLLAACGGTGGGTGSAGSTGSTGNTASSGGAGGTGGQPAKPEEKKNEEKITLRVGYFAGAQATVDVTNKVIALFEKKYPNIKIESEYSPFANYFEKLSVQAAGNSMPDVVRQDYAYLAQYVNKDLMFGLDDLVKQGKINLEGVDKKHLEGGMVNGKLYGINIGNNAFVSLYDPEAFAKAGVPLPTDNWTWQQYEQTVLQLKDKLNIYGDMHLGSNVFQIYLRQNGASFFNKDGTALGYDDDKLFTDFYDMVLRLQKAKALSPIAEELEAKAAEDTPFAKGKTVMDNQSWSNNLLVRETLSKKKLQMALVPGSGNGKGMYLKPSQFMSISKSSKQVDAAAQFIDFWMNDIEANKALNATLGFPYIPKVLDAMSPGFDEVQKKTAAYLKTVEKYAAAIDPPAPGNSGEVSKLLEIATGEIYFEKSSTKDAAAKFRKQANEILAKNKK